MAATKPKLKVSRKRKFINPITLFIILVLIAAGYGYLKTYPSYTSINELSLEIEEVKSDIGKKQEELSELVIKSKNLKPTDEEILRETQIPEDADITNLMRYLERITPYEKTPNIEKINLKSISIKEITVSKKEKKNQKTGMVGISLAFNSSTQAFRKLLNELERSDKRVFTITDVSITESNVGPLVERGKYSITMIAYNQLN